MIEIFFGKKIIYLTDEEEQFYAHYKDTKQLYDLIYKFKTNEASVLYISSKDLNDLFQKFKSIFTLHVAAGGLVLNEFHQVLAIKNRGIWQLPKGHVDEEETISEAAIREVTEETGIIGITIMSQLPSTFHIFEIDNKLHLKHTFWFKMYVKGFQKPIPQKEEDITDAIWVKKQDLDFIKMNTYPNLMKIWDFALT